ncbi:PAS domain-containing protein [bacterium]|nr:PAS domain-containing protein [bacterium]
MNGACAHGCRRRRRLTSKEILSHTADSRQRVEGNPPHSARRRQFRSPGAAKMTPASVPVSLPPLLLAILGVGMATLAAALVVQLRRQVRAAWAETGRVHATSTARFVAVGDLIDDVLFETDDHQILTYTNRAFHELTGFRRRDLRSGLSLADVLDLAGDDVRREFERPDQDQGVRVLRSHVCCRDGARVPVSIRMTPIAERERSAGWRCLVEPVAEETETTPHAVEALLGDILRDFNETPRDQHTAAIGRALAGIGRQVGADRCYHYAVSADDRHLESFSQWYAPGVSPMSGDRLLPGLDHYAWTLERLREDGVLAVPDVAELPADAVPEGERWRSQGITSLLVAPLRHGSRIVGIVGCETLGRVRTWGIGDRQLLEAIAQICQRVQNHDRTATRLDEANERASDLVDLLPEPVAIVDADGRVVAWNAALARLVDRDLDTVRGADASATLDEVLPGAGAWFAGKAEGECVASDFFVDGDRWLQLSVRPLKNRECIVHFCDITRVKQEECRIRDRAERLERTVADRDQQLQLARDRLVATQRETAVASMVSGLAQELDASVGDGLTAAGELLERTSELDRAYGDGLMTRSQFEDFLDVSRSSSALIVGNLQRAADLISGMRQAAVDQQVADRRRPIALRSYLGDMLASLAPRLRERHIDITFDCPDDLEIEADPGSLYRVVSNLVMNALQHGFEGMLVGEIRINAGRDGDRLVIDFEDNGRGMTSEQLERMYDPARRSGGAGLGLHIVYSLVTRTLGGTITCRSRSGSGTSFRIELPLTSEVRRHAHG